MEKYAYRDKYGVLHIISSQLSATERAAGEVKPVKVPNEYGYPCIEIEGELKQVVDYGGGETYVNGNVRNGIHISKVEPEIRFKVETLLQEIGL